MEDDALVIRFAFIGINFEIRLREVTTHMIAFLMLTITV